MKIRLETLEVLLTLLGRLVSLIIDVIEAQRKKEQAANGDAAALDEREVPGVKDINPVDQEIIDFA